MVYLIDKRIKYRTEDGSIWPLGDEESTVILTLTMNRLLACLLNRHGQVLTRNELLDDVWDAHGLRSSNHTLNKYISELRKCFSRLGISAECITTVPRVGFMFSRNIDVQIIDNDIPESPSQSETVLQQENTLQISKQAEESRSDLVEKKTNTLSAIQIHNIIVNYCNNEHYHVNREILVSREPNRRHKRYPEIFFI